MFIRGPADIAYHGQLLIECRSMLRPSDKVEVPDDPNAAGAWDRLWALRDALLRRESELPQIAPQTIARNRADQARAAEWNIFCQARQRLEEVSKYERSWWRSLSEFLRLEDGDLDPPDENRRDWREVSKRVRAAMYGYDALTPALREEIPVILDRRRQEARDKEMVRRLAALEAMLSQKQSTEIMENSNG